MTEGILCISDGKTNNLSMQLNESRPIACLSTILNDGREHCCAAAFTLAIDQAMAVSKTWYSNIWMQKMLSRKQIAAMLTQPYVLFHWCEHRFEHQSKKKGDVLVWDMSSCCHHLLKLPPKTLQSVTESNRANTSNSLSV